MAARSTSKAAIVLAVMTVVGTVLLMAGNASATYNRNKRLILTAEEPAGMVGFYTDEGELLGKVKVGLLPHEVITTRDGRRAFVTNFGLHDYASPTGYAGYTISVIDVERMVEEKKLYTFPAGAAWSGVQRAPHGVKLSPNEKELWVNCEYFSPDGTVTPQMLVYDLTDDSAHEPFRYLNFTSDTNKNHNFVFSPDGKTIWLQNGAQGLASMNPITGAISPAIRLGTNSVGVRGLVFAPDGKLVVSGVGELFIVDVTTSPPTTLKRYWSPDWLVNQFLYPAVTPDGKYILVTSTNGQVFVINYATGVLIKRIDVFGLDPVMAVPTRDSKRAYASAARGGALTSIDLTTTQFKTSLIATGVNAGPNGIAIVDTLSGVETDRVEFRVGAVLSLSGTGQPNGYKIKSALEMWSEGINLSGGVPLRYGDAARVVVRYFDDFSNASRTNGLLLDVIDDWSPHALIVAETAFVPTARLLRTIEAEQIPLVSVYPVGTAAKRGLNDDDLLAPLINPSNNKRQLAAGALVGHDRWVDAKQYSDEYVLRFSRNATVIDGQATMAGLALEAAAFNSGRITGSRFVSAVASLDTTFFYGKVKFAADGSNQGGIPVFVNNRA